MIDTGTTVLRVNQSKLRQEKGAWNDVALSLDSPPLPPQPYSVPRERSDVPRERSGDQLPGQGVPEAFWIDPRGVRTDVMELSTVLDLSLPCAVNAAFALDLVWQWEKTSLIPLVMLHLGVASSDGQPALFYIEPPEVTDLPEHERRSVRQLSINYKTK